MTRKISRRTIIALTTAAGAVSLLSDRAFAQGGAPAASLPARGEFIVRGAHVLTMDAALGDLPSGDVHVRNGAIVAVAANVPTPGAEVIDGRDMICMPGLIETHWHHWTNVCRPFVRNDDPTLGYFPVTAKYGPHYEPLDCYRSVQLGLAEALGAGITTTHNWCHNTRSPAMPMPRSPPCATSASAAATPMAPRKAVRMTDRWTWPISLASSAAGCRATGWLRSAFAPGTLATIPIRHAALSRPKWRRKSGVVRGNSVCRSHCTP